MITLRMVSIFISVLSLGLISSITTEITFEGVNSFRKSQLFDGKVREISSVILPLASSYLKAFQSSDIQKQLLGFSQSENGIDDFLSDFGIKIGRKNSLSNVRTASEGAISRSDSLSKFLKTVINAAEGLLAEQSIVNKMDNSVRILTSTFNSFPIENKEILKEALSDAIIKLLQSYGIFELEISPDWLNYYLEGIRFLVDNGDLFEIIPSFLPSNEKSKPNSDLELLYSGKMNTIEVPNMEHFKDEDSKSTPEWSSGSTWQPIDTVRSKRSIDKRKKSKSLYSVLSDAMSSSAALSESLKVLTSPEAKMSYGDLFSMIETFLGDENSQANLNELSEAIDSTFSYLTPEKLTEVFANAMEQLLVSTDRIIGGNDEEVFNRYVQSLKDAAESIDLSDSPTKHVVELGLTIYGFLLNEDISELENLRALMKNMISEMYSLSGVHKPNTDLLESSEFKEEQENNSIA